MKLGVIGTGSITKSMLAEYQRCDKFEIHAICSRKEETGRAMAEAFSIPKVYTELSGMLADPEIEIVYVATPNSIHFSQARAALEAGKHVICEKPFTPTVEQTQELIDLAKQKHVLLYEAITLAHHPHYQYIKDHLSELGRLKIITATFCQFSSRYPALLAGNPSPVLNHAFAGGALMDINLYNIHFIVGLFGAPKSVRYFANRHETGVDTSGILLLEYEDFLCQCIAAKDSAARNGVQIVGVDGYMEITPSSSNLQTVELNRRGQETETVHLPENPWYYEVQDLGRLVTEADYDACYEHLNTTVEVVRVLEQARKYAGFDF